jgi:hypothetical protein
MGRAPLGPGHIAGGAGHAGAVFHRHLHTRIRRNSQLLGGLASTDAADAVGLSVWLCLHESVPRSAVRQLRQASGGTDRVGGLHGGQHGLCAVAKHWATGVLPRAARPFHRRRHRGIARRSPRYVSTGAGTKGDEPGHHLLWCGARHCAHHRGLAICPPGLAQHLLVSGGRRHAALDLQLPVST